MGGKEKKSVKPIGLKKSTSSVNYWYISRIDNGIFFWQQ
jgi:hypothetical protein